MAIHGAAAAHIAHWKLTGRSVSPVEPSEAMETLELGYVNAGFLLFAAAILLTLIVGRFFCGWACHLVAYQDLCAWLLARIGLRPRPVRSRLLLWVPLAAALYMFVWPTAHRLWRGEPNPEWQNRLIVTDLWATFPGPWMTAMTFVVCGFLMVYWLGAKGFCTYGCPYGAAFSVAERFAPVRIRVTDACEGCGHCSVACSSNVAVADEVARFGMVVDPGCMRCTDCISVCPKDALHLGVGRPSLTKPQARSDARRSDFSWPEEMLLVAAGALGFAAWRGLYSYVPMLLAIGLGVLTAIAAVVLGRLLRLPTVGFQSRSLRTDGRWTRWGVAAAALCAGWLALTAHSGWVRAWTAVGQANAQAWTTARDAGVPTADSLARLARDQLGSARRSGLFTDPALEWTLARMAIHARDADAARDHLTRALACEPGWAEPALELAQLHMAQRDLDATERVLDALLSEHPDHGPARARRAYVDAVRAGQRGDRAGTIEALRRAVDSDPGFAPAARDLERLGG